MAKDRPPSFQFYPRDFMADTGHLTDRQRSRYLLALCRSWLEGGFGVGWVSEWREWGGYSSDSEWAEDLPELRSLFWVAPVGEEAWVQRRMVEERLEQASRYQNLKNRPQNTRGGRPVAHREVTVVHREPTVEPQSSASASAIESKSEDLVSDAGPGEEKVSKWMTGFEAWWLEYPRKVAKEAAKAEYRKIRPRTDETYTLLFEGLELHRATQWQGREQDTIPHASTWLHQRRFTDAQPESVPATETLPG